jgi:hypothetical protein
MAEFSFRLHEKDGQVLLAAADADLLGKELVVPKTGARFSVKPEFYGEPATASQLAEAFKKADHSNLLGERTIGLLGLGDSDAIILSGPAGRKVPHIQAVIVR